MFISYHVFLMSEGAPPRTDQLESPQPLPVHSRFAPGFQIGD